MNAEEAGVYRELYDTQIPKFNKSRDLEWKVNISLWSLIAAGIIAIDKFNFLEQAACYWRCGLFLFVVAVHFLWMMLIQRSENIDFEWALKYRRRCEDALNMQPIDQRTSVSARRIDFIWIVAPVLVTIILMSLFLVGATHLKNTH